MTEPTALSYPPELLAAVRAHPYPLLFATVSGSHLCGFPSTDSDWDLRGVHVLPLPEVLGLGNQRDTVKRSEEKGGVELDTVTYDIHKFAGMLLKRDGNVLEQVLSPLVVCAAPAHTELCELARKAPTRYHAYHYLGFTANQWQQLEKEEQPRVKPLLYAFRTVLTGLHLMRSGELEANLETLNAEARLPYLNELIATKRGGGERELLGQPLDFYRTEHARLVAQLEEAKDSTHLPSNAPDEVRAALSDLVVRVRMATPKGLRSDG